MTQARLTSSSRSLAGQAAELRQPEKRLIIAKMKDDTSSLRAVVRSSQGNNISVRAETESVLSSTRFDFDQEMLQTVPYQKIQSEKRRQLPPSARRPAAGKSKAQERTERYTSGESSDTFGRPAEPARPARNETRKRYTLVDESPDANSINRSIGLSPLCQPRGMYTSATSNRDDSSSHAGAPSPKYSQSRLQTTSPSESGMARAQDKSATTLSDYSSMQSSGLTSPSIVVCDPDSSSTGATSGSSTTWTLPTSSQSSLPPDNLSRSTSTYSWRDGPSGQAPLRSTPSPRRPSEHNESGSHFSLWNTIRRNTSVSTFFLFPKSSRSSMSNQSFSPGPGPRRGHQRSASDTKRSVDLTKENLPGLVVAAQDGNCQEVERLLGIEERIEQVTSVTKRSALAVAAHCGHEKVVALLLSRGAQTETKDLYGMTPLHLASARGHLKAVETLIGWAASLDAESANGKTPLSAAVEDQWHDVVKYLLQKGASINARDHAKLTPLHVASMAGDAEMVNLLLSRRGVDLEARDGESMAPLHYAVDGGHLRVADALLSKGAHVDCRGKWQTTSLMLASSKGHVKIAELLIKRGAKVKLTSDGNMNAIHWACLNGGTDILELLLQQKKLKVDSVTSEGCTPLHIAVMSRNFAAVDYLLRNKATQEFACCKGWRALHYACDRKDVELVRHLVNNKASIEATNKDQQRPIHIATLQGSLDIIKILVDQNATLDCLDKNGDRPLTLACMVGHAQIVGFLLNAGSTLQLKFREGPSNEDSPMCVAAQHGHEAVIRELIRWQALVLQPDERGWQPLRYAAFHGHLNVVNLLLQHGASVSALGLGSPTISNTSCIKFAAGVAEDVKPYIIERLEWAEAEERSAQELKRKLNYPLEHGYVEMDSESTPTVAARTQWDMFDLARKQQLAMQSSSRMPAGFMASTLTRTSEQADRISQRPAAPFNNSEAAFRAGNSAGPVSAELPRRAQTTRPRSTISGFGDAGDTAGLPSAANVARSITIATARDVTPMRAPRVPSSHSYAPRHNGHDSQIAADYRSDPYQQYSPAFSAMISPPSHLDFEPTSSQPPASHETLPLRPSFSRASSADGSVAAPLLGPSQAERLKLFRVTCAVCKSQGKQAPDLLCAQCFQQFKDYESDEENGDLYEAPQVPLQEMWVPREEDEEYYAKARQLRGTSELK